MEVQIALSCLYFALYMFFIDIGGTKSEFIFVYVFTMSRSGDGEVGNAKSMEI